MSNRSTDMHRLQELVRLHRKGEGCREVARLLKMSPNTERRYREALKEAELLAGPVTLLPELEVLKAAVKEYCPPKQPHQEVSSIQDWAEAVEGLMSKGLKPRAIYDRFKQEEKDFSGSYWAIKRLCRSLKRARGVQAEDVAIPVETEAGHVAQVDFGYVGKLYDPQTQKTRRAWAFVMVLGHSRHMVVRVVFDQKTETWLRVHVEAFRELGGVVEVVVPDNLKAAVIRAAFAVDGPTALNRSYRELARHHDFTIDPAPPYQANKKGKVESGVKYVKNNFFKGRDGEDVTDVRRKLANWVSEIAGMREHGTTFKRPLEVFSQQEQSCLKPLPQTPFELMVWKEVTVHQDCHVAFDRRLYSAPWKLVGQQVWVRATAATVMVYADDERVATHSRKDPGYRSTQDEHLPEYRRDLRHRSRSYWEQRADLMGDTVGLFIREVFDSDAVLSQLRKVQSMVLLLETVPQQRAEAACLRAHFFGNLSYQGLKNILRKDLDQHPLPLVLASTPLENPRFARSLDELLHIPREGHHEPN